jgi:tetratricopeptide (TPR) repeat protein
LINEASFIERFYTFPKILLTFIRLIIFPISLRTEYHFVVHTFKDIHVWLGMPFLILFFVSIGKFLKPKRHALFFSSWFLLGLLPYYNIIIPLHATLMEHWAYFSSMGFAALMAIALFNFIENVSGRPKKVMLIIGLVILLSYYVVRIIERNKEWRDPFVLYQNDLKREPKSFLLHCNLGVEYFRRGLMEDAKREFIASNEVCPGKGYDVAYNNLGVIYAREGNIPKAIDCYRMSIALNDYALAYENLGSLYNNLGMHKEVVQLLESAAQVYPLNAGIKYQLEIAYKKLGANM